MAKKGKILIVEDEILIADTIQRYVERQGYEVTGIAIAYEEAIELYQAGQPDLVLIDIRLSGPRTGVDFAVFIREQPQPIPFIYLTSQTDSRSIDQAKRTFPAGYLAKPIQSTSLYAGIEIALHRHRSETSKEPTLAIYDGESNYIVRYKDILYLEADHIYVKVYTRQYGRLMQRCSLKEMMAELPSPPFFRVHRGFVINLDAVTGWGQQEVFVDGQVVPVSRSRWKAVMAYLRKEG